MKKVLLIEDDPVLRENTAELLELSGYKVVMAPDGKRGVESALRERPDIVVCDIMMPELDGYGVLKALSNRSETRHIPFIFLSAKTERKEIRIGMEMGADDYLTKPFEEEELVNAIESRIAKMEILRESGDMIISNSSKEEDILSINELKNHFLDEGEHFKYNDGEHIYQEGDHSNYIYLVETGMVKTYTIDEQGKEFITRVNKDDDLFGYTSFTQTVPYRESATAMKSTSVYGIKKDHLYELLLRNGSLMLELIDLLSEDVTGFKEQLAQMAYGSVRKKTASTILKFVDKLRKRTDDGIRISRSDLASVAGIAPESFIRTLSDFKREHMILIEGRNIKVLDEDRLAQVD